MEDHEKVITESTLLQETPANSVPEEIVPDLKVLETDATTDDAKHNLSNVKEASSMNDVQVNGGSPQNSAPEKESEIVVPVEVESELETTELNQNVEQDKDKENTEHLEEQEKTVNEMEVELVNSGLNKENGENLTNPEESKDDDGCDSVSNSLAQMEESATEERADPSDKNTLSLSENSQNEKEESKSPCNGEDEKVEEVSIAKFGSIEIVHVEKVYEEGENLSNAEELSQVEDELDGSTEPVVEKQKSMIQDIFDDWQDEMVEEEMCSKSTDAVELELKSLMDDGKSTKDDMETRLITIEVLEEGQKFDGESDKRDDGKKNCDDDPANKSCGEIVASLLKDGSLPVKTTIGLLNPPSDSEGSGKGQTKSRLLTGQLSSPAVAQVMKERIREKQKSLEPPVGLDVMFVKKLTQRLSSKLAAVPPADISAVEKEQNKESDNKELLAILEGEPDPDWSNVKSSSEEESNNKPSNQLEREIALKQLLELPGTPTKRKRKTKSKNADEEENEKEEKVKSSEEDKADKETKEEAVSSPSTESRAGRKRKLTEKGRVHEENSNIKRQKLTKTKTPEPPKRSEKTKKSEEKSTPKKSEEKPTPKKSEEKSSPKKSEEKSTSPEIAKKKNSEEEKSEEKEAEKSTEKKTEKSDEQKSTKTKPMVKKKVKPGRSKELEKLLQDEGVVNILYDVEQGDRTRRLIPITKTHAKWQDMEKAEQELRKRQEMVREAVFGSSSASSRPKRTVQNEKPEKGGKKLAKKIKPLVLSNELVAPATVQRNAAEDSVIFRRHSTSSYSSAPGSPRIFVHDNENVEGKKNVKRKIERVVTLPLEGPDSTDESEDEKEEKKKARKSPLITRKRSRDTLKCTKQSDSSGSDLEKKDQDVLSVVLAEAATALSSDTNSSTKKTKVSPSKSSDDSIFSNKEINVRRCGKLVQLILTPSSSSKLRNGITLQAMKEFCQVLSILKTDNECHGVILTSTGTSFCEGLDIESLLQEDKEERRKNAEKLASGVKEFISSLANFNKPIVAGIQGDAVGLGVTMLLLFDLVIASDKATFHTPYGKLGQIPEGLSILTLSHTLGATFTNELLIGGRTMTANEALTAGLVSRILWPDRFQAELFTSLKSMSEHSLQSMQATKSLLRSKLREKLDQALATESKLLIQHWCSDECQERIKIYLDEQIQ